MPLEFVWSTGFAVCQKQKNIKALHGAFAAREVASAPEDEPVLKAGDRIQHKAFGIGTVVKVDASSVTIDFPKVGEKRLGLAWCMKNCIVG